ncbi:hypothetical protein PVL29_018368 [Vitis rotundifolia]|uniref:Uncharacterized protein n=1 Tax=Vitis rotundifolia TaxID=103349 RepID=A0AA38Z5H5_VITRO|nr:hypothetical protein PVL29_018368 [Vitis rotundifolia]
MPPKGRGSKALVKGSSSRTPKGARDENLPINPPIQTLSIPKAPTKTSIDGIPFNAFPKKFYRDLYTKVYSQRSLVLERQLHLESFLDTPIPALFAELGWLPLVSFTRIACAPIFRMFYLNIIEHDLDEPYLKSSFLGIFVKVTLKVIDEVLGIPLVEAPSIEGALGSKNKVCHRRAKIQIGENDSNSSVLAQLCARFDALDEKFFA